MLTDERIDEIVRRVSPELFNSKLDYLPTFRAIEAEVRAEVCRAQNTESEIQAGLTLTDDTQFRIETREPWGSTGDTMLGGKAIKEQPTGCHRSHPHENMSAECEVKTVEARRVFMQAQEPASCPHCDGTGDVHSLDGEWRGECNCGAEKYAMIDRFLRNNLSDDDYAEYSAALDVVAAPQPPAPCPEPLDESRYCPDCEALQDELAVQKGMLKIARSERDALQAKVAEQSAQIKGLGEALTRQHNSGEEIAGQAMRAEEEVEQQSVLIEKCRVGFLKMKHKKNDARLLDIIADAYLAAIAAQKGGA